ncbi:MAG: hypothetical protein KDD64_15420 [Bdellovibrionales bacterium]|nr:hypothetical protein [Bdellovibrionales bacterium]
MLSKAKQTYVRIGQYVGALSASPSKAQGQAMLFLLGVGLLTIGLIDGAAAQAGNGGVITYNDTRVSNSINAIMTYIEGSFGALVMIAAGIGAILSSAFGQYRAALGLLVVAVGAFILRSFVSTFFNDANILENT